MNVIISVAFGVAKFMRAGWDLSDFLYRMKITSFCLQVSTKLAFYYPWTMHDAPRLAVPAERLARILHRELEIRDSIVQCHDNQSQCSFGDIPICYIKQVTR